MFGRPLASRDPDQTDCRVRRGAGAPRCTTHFAAVVQRLHRVEVVEGRRRGIEREHEVTGKAAVALQLEELGAHVVLVDIGQAERHPARRRSARIREGPVEGRSPPDVRRLQADRRIDVDIEPRPEGLADQDAAELQVARFDVGIGEVEPPEAIGVEIGKPDQVGEHRPRFVEHGFAADRPDADPAGVELRKCRPAVGIVGCHHATHSGTAEVAAADGHGIADFRLAQGKAKPLIDLRGEPPLLLDAAVAKKRDRQPGHLGRGGQRGAIECPRRQEQGMLSSRDHRRKVLRGGTVRRRPSRRYAMDAEGRRRRSRRRPKHKRRRCPERKHAVGNDTVHELPRRRFAGM